MPEKTLGPTSRSYVLLCYYLLCALPFLSACASSSLGRIPAGTPDHGNGTPSVLQLAPTPALTAPAGSTGATYAFVRQNQLWLANHTVHPYQVTHFDFSGLPDVFWHRPLWSQGDRYIAFIVAARPGGQGGGGCPAPDYSANGGLYVLNVAAQQLTAIVARGAATPGDKPRTDSWQYVFWQDASHLLAWYNDASDNGKTSATGLYRYDLASGKLALVLPLHALGVATLFNFQPGLPILLSMRYSDKQLFYQVVVHPFERDSQFIIYRHAVDIPDQASSRVLSTGTVPWCVGQQISSFVAPGWDISPDGTQLVAQLVVGSTTSGVQVLNLRSAERKSLFAQVLFPWPAFDLTLTWGPDSQMVVTLAASGQHQQGLFSASLAETAAAQHYLPALSGQVAWRADGRTFAVTSSSPGSAGEVYLFVPGTVQGRVLLSDAQIFVWG